MSSDVEKYISNIEDPKLRVLAGRVREVAKKALPGVTERIWMGIPNFSANGKNIACIADYSHHINLYFLQGAKLSSKLLEGTGKGMRHIKISSESDIKEAEIAKLLKQASRLN